METMSDLWGVGMTNAAISAADAFAPGTGSPVNRLMKKFMPRTPLMYPES
jgi:hypothetical protein